MLTFVRSSAQTITQLTEICSGKFVFLLGLGSTHRLEVVAGDVDILNGHIGLCGVRCLSIGVDGRAVAHRKPIVTLWDQELATRAS